MADVTPFAFLQNTRVAAIGLALAALVIGFGAPMGPAVHLLTGETGCYAGGEGGFEDVLQADPVDGTRFGGRPVIWPDGFTAVRLDAGEVGVINADHRLVATTGRRYFISIALPLGGTSDLVERVNGWPAAVDCGYPWDFVAR